MSFRASEWIWSKMEADIILSHVLSHHWISCYVYAFWWTKLSFVNHDHVLFLYVVFCSFFAMTSSFWNMEDSNLHSCRTRRLRCHHSRPSCLLKIYLVGHWCKALFVIFKKTYFKYNLSKFICHLYFCRCPRDSPLEWIKIELWREAQKYPLFHSLQETWKYSALQCCYLLAELPGHAGEKMGPLRNLWLLTSQQCCGPVTFLYGSGSSNPCLWLIDPAPDPASFVIDLQDANK